MSAWTIPDGESESNSVWFGLEAVLGCIAPAMTALTTHLQLQASADPMSVVDADTTFADVTVEGIATKFTVSASAGKADTLTNLIRYPRLRIKALETGGGAQAQTGAKVVGAATVRL